MCNYWSLFVILHAGVIAEKVLCALAAAGNSSYALQGLE